MLSSLIYLMKVRANLTLEIAALNAAIVVLAIVMAFNKIFKILQYPHIFVNCEGAKI